MVGLPSRCFRQQHQQSLTSNSQDKIGQELRQQALQDRSNKSRNTSQDKFLPLSRADNASASSPPLHSPPLIALALQPLLLHPPPLQDAVLAATTARHPIYPGLHPPLLPPQHQLDGTRLLLVVVVSSSSLLFRQVFVPTPIPVLLLLPILYSCFLGPVRINLRLRLRLPLI